MGKGRQAQLLSYLALAMLIVGALVHGLPASAAKPSPGWRLDAVVDAAGAGDHGVLPHPSQPLDLRDQRAARPSLDSGADGDALALAFAGGIGTTGGVSFFLFDCDLCGAAAPRLAHRPRDPPRLS